MRDPGRFLAVIQVAITFLGALASAVAAVSIVAVVAAYSERQYETTRDALDWVDNRWSTTTVSKYDYTNDTVGRRTRVDVTGMAFSASGCIWILKFLISRSPMARA